MQVEQYVRDLRVHGVLEGTNEIVRIIISRHLVVGRSTHVNVGVWVPGNKSIVVGGRVDTNSKRVGGRGGWMRNTNTKIRRGGIQLGFSTVAQYGTWTRYAVSDTVARRYCSIRHAFLSFPNTRVGVRHDTIQNGPNLAWRNKYKIGILFLNKPRMQK